MQSRINLTCRLAYLCSLLILLAPTGASAKRTGK